VRKKGIIKKLMKTFPQTYSEELGIDLKSEKASEIFKWFLASILFGKPIRESSAIKTYRCFERHGVLSPKRILETGWQGLVDILDEGCYTRYDFSTADKLLEVMKNLERNYSGSIINLYEKSRDQADLESKLKSLGKGIGEVTINIFLRELRGIWNVEPLPSRFTIIAAKNLKLIKTKDPSPALKELKEIWRRSKVKNKCFVNFETALLRLGKDYCRKKRCKICIFNRNK
jgi:endonuclease III